MTFLDQWRHDLWLAVRGLDRARAFAGAAVLTLCVGIAGSAVMFALIQGVLMRPLPVRDQDQVLIAWTELRSSGFSHWPFFIRDVAVIAKESRLFQDVAGVGYNGAIAAVAIENGSASYIRSVSVTGDFFRVLDVRPLLGRAFNRVDDVAGAENVLVITYALWQRRYGGSPDVLGRRLTISERPFTIVGVMPPDVEYPRGVEAWMTTAALTSALTNAAFRVDVDLIVRTRPGTTIAQATSELGALSARLDADSAASSARPAGLTPVVRSFESVLVGDVRPAMLVLFGAVALVLVIATANVANLLLLRGETRRSEMAVRAALGASGGRLTRQLLAESLVLAIFAGALGLGAAWWSLQALVALVPDGLPRVDSVRVDLGVVLFTTVIACVTATLAGLVPSLSSARIDLAVQLRSGGRGLTPAALHHGRRALVVAQVAIAVTVVAAAGLLIRSLLALQSVEMGLAADRMVFVDLAMPHAKYGDRARHLQFLNDVIAQLEAAPAIAGATPVNAPPFAGAGGWDAPLFTAEGQSAGRAAENPSLNLEAIHPNYFATFAVPIIRGRAFTRADREGAPEVAIVSEDVARRTWGGVDPVGKRMKLGGPDSTDHWRTVVGVVGPTRYRELAEPRATLYLPAEQFLVTAARLALRTSAPLELVASVARERVRAVDADVQVVSIAPFDAMLERPLARPRFNAFVLAIFGTSSLSLAAIGLYAVMAGFVRQRDNEIGIRIALGATAADIRRLVVGEGLHLAGVGVVIGLAGAVGSTRLLRTLLFDVHPLDPQVLLGAVLLLVGVAAAACYVPARRAARVDPIAMLRMD